MVPLLDPTLDAEQAVINGEAEAQALTTSAPPTKSSKALVISFLLMVVIGLGNKIFQVRHVLVFHVTNVPMHVDYTRALCPTGPGVYPVSFGLTCRCSTPVFYCVPEDCRTIA